MADRDRVPHAPGGHFGPWTVKGPNLTLDELRSLPDGTEIEIVWSGGNGPHRGVIVREEGFDECWYVSAREDMHGTLRFYNPIGTFVGEHPRTQVRRVRG